MRVWSCIRSLNNLIIFLDGGVFLWLIFLYYGWGMGLENARADNMHEFLNVHTIGYVIIALVYVFLAFSKN